MIRSIAAFLLFFLAGNAGISHAATKDGLFLQSFEGQWNGPGTIIAGKYKGTKFTCSLAGMPEMDTTGMTLEGTCRLGIFSQPMKARVIRGTKGYYGMFNDGANGKGLDITSGTVSKNRMVFGLYREKLNGTMTAHLTEDDSMNITLAIKVRDAFIPVIDMKLKRNTPSISSRLAKN